MSDPATRLDLSDANLRVRELIRDSPFLLFLVWVDDGEVLEVSRPLESWSGRSRTELVGMRMYENIADPATAKRSLALLAAGVLDAYTRRAMYNHPDGSTTDFEVSLTAYVEESPRRTAVAMIRPAGTSTPKELEAAPVNPEISVVGTVDASTSIDRITSDVTDLLGYPAAEVLCRSALDLVHPDDVSSLLLLAAYAGERPTGTFGRVRVLTARREWLLCRLVIQPLAGKEPLAFAFTLSPLVSEPRPDRARARELEEHLRRIAREIAASGVVAMSTTMPTSAEVPEISRLTSREYEIVVRLAAGDRVPTIARGMFLSESTVRNHLTSVYRKLGVRSQHELMARLHSIH
jgi:DNA-binding CsgD family transcriptional regulator/PAS domain-containing protein